MDDKYIKCEDAMWAACKALCHPCVRCPENICAEVRDVFDAIPAADVAPVRHGRWIVEQDVYFGFSSVEIKCSECNSHPKDDEMTSFCPSCGARMGMGTDYLR